MCQVLLTISECIPMHFYELQELFSVIIDRKKYKEKSDRLIRYLIQSKNTDRVIMECLFDSITKLCKEDRIEYLLLFINENPSIDDFRTVPLTSLSDSWSGSQIPLIEKNFFIAWIVRCDFRLWLSRTRSIYLWKNKDYGRMENNHSVIGNTSWLLEFWCYITWF